MPQDEEEEEQGMTIKANEDGAIRAGERSFPSSKK
jgi:hypothetical protein